MKNKLINILTSSWMLAMVIALIIFCFTYSRFKEYSVEKIQEEGKYYDEYRFFYDVDNDSVDDNVDIKYFETVKSKGIRITNDDGKILSTGIVAPYKFPNFYRDPYVTNKQEDSVKNLFYIIEMGDSLFLGTNRLDTLLEQIFLDTIYSEGQFKNVPKSYDYGYFGTYNVNNKGFPELYLYISEGYRIFPRRLYCVDYKNNKVLKRSVLFGAFPVEYEQFIINGLPYFVIGSQATSNMNEFKDYFLCDTGSYFMVFDEDLKFKFEPIKMGETSSRVYFFLKEIDGEHFFYVFANPYDESKKVNLKKINLKGRIIEQYDFKNNLKAVLGGVFSIENDIYYIDKNYNYHKFNVITKEDRQLKIDFIEKPFWLNSYDIDNDGDKEHLFRDKSSNKIYITRKDISKPAKIELPLNQIENARFYFPEKGNNKNLIFVSTYKTYYTFEYLRAPYYLLKLLGFIVVLFSGSFALVYSIQAILKYRLQKRAKVTARIKELEFYNVRSQMNPHFTLNTLNFISSSILKQEKEKAYDVISGFSNIIRSTLLDANKILRKLDEELSFVMDYLKIQKARYDRKFDFKINIEKQSLKDLKVPPFIVQIFVENSLKHGLKDITEGGLIEISVFDDEKSAIIEIEDNGIGRKKAAKNKAEKSTGKGLKITEEYIKLINSLNKEKILIKYIDKIENGKSKGLRVSIKIPRNLKI